MTTLRSQAMQDITASDLPGADGLMRRAVLRVLAWVQAGLAHLHYGYLDWISRMAVPFTARDEFLEAWAGLKGVTRKPATATTGAAVFLGTNGAVIPLGTGMTLSNGTAYTATDSATIAAGFATVPFAADIAGSAGNFETNAPFTLTGAIAGVTALSDESAQYTAGTDIETDAALRTRMLQVYAAPPQGGDRQDYIEWALAVPGVTRAWVAPNLLGVGTVGVYVMLDLAEAAFAGFPQGSGGVASAEPRDAPATSDLLTVADAIFPLQPVTALVYAIAPDAQAVDFAIINLGLNNTAAMHTAIEAALTDMFLRLGAVGGTVNPADGTAWPAFQPSDAYTALAAIPGLTAFDIDDPVNAITPAAGKLLVLGSVLYTA